MDDDPYIIVTWAILIEAQLFDARVEAYVESKVANHTFQLCIQYAHADQALTKMLVEVFEMIVSQTQQHIFDQRQEWQQDVVRCCFLAYDCEEIKRHKIQVSKLLSKVGQRLQGFEKDDFDKCRQIHNQ